MPQQILSPIDYYRDLVFDETGFYPDDCQLDIWTAHRLCEYASECFEIDEQLIDDGVGLCVDNGDRQIQTSGHINAGSALIDSNGSRLTPHLDVGNDLSGSHVQYRNHIAGHDQSGILGIISGIIVDIGEGRGHQRRRENGQKDANC